jgi:acetyltransferase-like isoleucine patch superfamily enzyme
MNMPNNQLRSHLHFGIVQQMRNYFQKRRLGDCGRRVFFENNVKILRYPQNVSIGSDVVIKEGCRICSCNEHAIIRIGEQTTIGYHSFLFASEEITIGSDCLIAPFVYIVDSDHGIARSMKINVQSNITSPIHVGNDVWVGTGAKILKGVTIGNGAIIAAGSIVNKNVDEYQIVGGIPAQILGIRS